MTLLKLQRDLSFCRVDGHLIFLDIRNDRYFRLDGCLESALVTYLDNCDVPKSSIRRLIERKILTEESGDIDHTPLPSAPVPTRSAAEEADPIQRASIKERLDTFALIYSIQRQLRTRSLKQTLRNLSSFREKRAPQASMSCQSEAHVLKAAAAFRNARLYVPVETCCLLDSIAMITFLAKRELHTDLVFGVTGAPFSAHSWAQHGNTVLNDALGHALAFTPIRTI